MRHKTKTFQFQFLIKLSHKTKTFLIQLLLNCIHKTSNRNLHFPSFTRRYSLDIEQKLSFSKLYLNVFAKHEPKTFFFQVSSNFSHNTKAFAFRVLPFVRHRTKTFNLQILKFKSIEINWIASELHPRKKKKLNN